MDSEQRADQTDAQVPGWALRPDAELVRWAAYTSSPQVQEGALAEVYRRHSDAIIRQCARMLNDPLTAEDLAHETFEAAFTDLLNGRPPRQPERLRAWLCGIAKNRVRQRWKDNAHYTAMQEADAEDDDWETASKRRAAQAERLLNLVVTTLTEREQAIYRYSVRDGLIGRDLAPLLNTSPVQASRLAREIITTVNQGFGALISARDGRPVLSQAGSDPR
jgi:RNA polymerase sigma factor (sigma-70 family)